MSEAFELLTGGFDDARMRVPDVEAAHPAGEVDERVPVDVGDRGAVRLCDHDRQVDGERLGDDARLALEDVLAAWPRNIRLAAARLAARLPPFESEPSSGLTNFLHKLRSLPCVPIRLTPVSLFSRNSKVALQL